MPVWPEKNRSAQKFSLPIIPVLSIKILSGYGPIWVSVTKTERITINSAIDLRIYGICWGYARHQNKMKKNIATIPAINSASTSCAFVLLKTMSVTGLRPCLVA